MISAPSASETAHATEPRLHRGVLRWIHEQGWRSLRPVQIAALDPILAADPDVIISAPTAGGKTEAAFLPICSVLADSRDAGTIRPGIDVLYISPLKALINDQFSRLELLCQHVDIPVHRWHGDVAASAKARVRRRPDGIVIITPESLEALLITGSADAERILSGLQFLVIDELHAFIGSERGAQLQSLLHRVEHVARRRVPRIALSATLSDVVAAADYLRPGEGEQVRYLDPGGHADVRLRVFGHLQCDPNTVAADQPSSAEESVSRQLFKTLRSSDHLVFANSRARVELFTDRLTRMSERARVPNEFFPHHGNLSKEVREYVETRLKNPATPTTAICTSTLEMGIDIGSVDSVAQIGPPPGVASLRQRIGRSGRRGAPPTLRIHVPEDAPSPEMGLTSELRAQLVQTIAMVELMGEKWLEPPNSRDLHLSTLVQQVLSVVAQHGGASASSLYRVLCTRGPFRQIDQRTFAALLRAMGGAELLSQGEDGLLLPGVRGDRLINHYSFYAVFHTPQEFRVVVGDKTLGTLPIERPIHVGSLIIFAGQRWRVRDIDVEKRLIQLTPSSGGKPPSFPPGGVLVADTVRKRMRTIYQSDHQPGFLDDTALTLLNQGRAAFSRLRLAETAVLGRGNDTVLVPWRGDTVMNTLAVLLQSRGLQVGHEGLLLTISKIDPGRLRRHIQELAAAPPANPVELAASVAVKAAEKYDGYLSDDLLSQAYAARSLDIPNTWHALHELSAQTTSAKAAPVQGRPGPVRSGRRVELGVTPFAVLDVETTGFDPYGRDRIIEIAIVRLSPTGDPVDRWTTIVNPGRSPGPTHIHGLTAEDLRGAPTFGDLDATIASRLDGAVLVAHNADFDRLFLTAEFERLDRTAPLWPTLCTLALSYRLGSAFSRRLSDLCSAEGITHVHQHSALGDADATARLLRVYLHRAAAGGINTMTELGVSPTELPPAEAQPGTPAPTRVRASAATTSTPPRTPTLASGDPRIDIYLEVLDQALADQVLDADEITHLRRIADDIGLSANDLAAAHRRALADISDAVVSTRLTETLDRIAVVAAGADEL